MKHGIPKGQQHVAFLSPTGRRREEEARQHFVEHNVPLFQEGKHRQDFYGAYHQLMREIETAQKTTPPVTAGGVSLVKEMSCQSI